jgi:autotransporter-associated beta strand protein
MIVYIYLSLSVLLWLGLMSVQNANAGSGSWNNSAGGNWMTNGNWAGSAVASGIGANASFSSINLVQDAKVSLGVPLTLGSIGFADTSPSNDWLVQGEPGAVLTLARTNDHPSITVHNQTAILAIDLDGGNGLSKSGGGTLILTGNNKYTGPTMVTQGVLRLSSVPILPGDLEVMPLGDSITEGYDGTNAGYRGFLYSLLFSVSPEMRFLGTSVEMPGALPVSPIYQRFHEGHPSYTINDISNNIDGFDNSRFLEYGGIDRDPKGGHWLDGIPNVRPAVYPDVIAMMVGTNDVLNLAGAQTRLHLLIEKITTLRPDTALIVGQITPLAAMPELVKSYNESVRREVESFQAEGRKVFLVNLNEGFPAGGLIADGVHPNDLGFEFMARRWYDAIVLACWTGEGALPKNSPTVVSEGAVLDINGCRAAVADLSGAGGISMGEGGYLEINNLNDSIFSGSISGNGLVVKDGPGVLELTESNSFSDLHVRKGIVRIVESAMEVASIEVSSGALIEFAGGSLTATRIRIRQGGQVRVVGGGVLHVSESLMNLGSLDLITGNLENAGVLENYGEVLDPSVIKVESISVSAGIVKAAIRSYSGHSYQLQHSESLEAGTWMNVGEAREGVTGEVVEESVTATNQHGFYRFKVSP